MIIDVNLKIYYLIIAKSLHFVNKPITREKLWKEKLYEKNNKENMEYKKLTIVCFNYFNNYANDSLQRRTNR